MGVFLCSAGNIRDLKGPKVDLGLCLCWPIALLRWGEQSPLLGCSGRGSYVNKPAWSVKAGKWWKELAGTWHEMQPESARGVEPVDSAAFTCASIARPALDPIPSHKNDVEIDL